MAELEKRHLDATILEKDDKGVSRATGVLSLIFRRTLAELGVNATMWNRLMLGYLSDKRNRIPNNSRARSSTRGNLTKELSKPNMTWRNFEKGIKFLNPVEATFNLRMVWRTGAITHHSITLMGENRNENVKPPTMLPDPRECRLLEKIGRRPGYFPTTEDEHLLLDALLADGYIKTIVVLDKNNDFSEGYALDVEGYQRILGEEP